MCPAGKGEPALPSSWPLWGARPGWGAQVTSSNVWKSLQVWGQLGAQDKEGGGPRVAGW